jgi:hypothetical protein
LGQLLLRHLSVTGQSLLSLNHTPKPVHFRAVSLRRVLIIQGGGTLLDRVLTLVAVGSAAALSVREASRRFAGFAAFAHRLPYASVGLIGSVGIVLAVLGLKHISR